MCVARFRARVLYPLRSHFCGTVAFFDLYSLFSRPVVLVYGRGAVLDVLNIIIRLKIRVRMQSPSELVRAPSVEGGFSDQAGWYFAVKMRGVVCFFDVSRLTS